MARYCHMDSCANVTPCELHEPLAAQLGPQYGLHLRQVRGPRGNTNRVKFFDVIEDSSRTRVVARLHSPEQSYRSTAYVQVELTVLKVLREANFTQVPRTLVTLRGSEFFLWHHGERQGHGVLFDYIKGKSEAPCVAHLPQLGVFLGKVHSTLAYLFSPSAVRATLKLKDAKEPMSALWVRGQLERTLPHFEKSQPTKQHLVSLIREILKTLGKPHTVSSLPHGVIHTDLNHTNVLWDEGKLAAVLDWDFVTPGALLLDVALALPEWCVVRQSEGLLRLDLDCVRIFVEAYNSQRPLVPDEKRALFRTTLESSLRSINWLIDEPNWRCLPYLDHLAPTLRYLLDLGSAAFYKAVFDLPV